jgi:hypothetical protein
LHFLSGFWEQFILPVSIHISNQYHASPYHPPSTCPYDDNWWWWGGHLVHLWCAGLDLKFRDVDKNQLLFAFLAWLLRTINHPVSLHPYIQPISC